MKIAVLLGDGMADLPIEEQGGRTVLEIAETANMDSLASLGVMGLASTVPQGYTPGSDVANLSIFGYDPAECYTGRAPLEAAAMGVELGPDDIAYRMNLVTLIAGVGEVFMDDFSAGHISSEEAARIVKTLDEELGSEEFEFYPGVSYRHLMVWRNGKSGAETVPPHDIIGKPIHLHLPKGEGDDELVGLMTGSQILLKNHPVNEERAEELKKDANSIWLWGQGGRPAMTPFVDKYGLTGGVVSAVDLVKGIGAVLGLKTPDISGATGYIDTNYANKVAGALNILEESDFVYLHVEAPDEAGHAGSLEDKVKAIEDFDIQIVGEMKRALDEVGEPYKLLVMPDHPTPIALKTHTLDPVPFIVYESVEEDKKTDRGFNEREAKAADLFVDGAHKLMPHLTGGGRLW